MMSLMEDTDTPDSQYLVASISRMPWSFRCRSNASHFEPISCG